MTKTILLASGSPTRKKMLANAGVSLRIETAAIDEPAIIAALVQEKAAPGDIADTLAEYKGRRVAAKNPADIVVAADQILICNGEIFSKPATVAEALADLKKLRGQGHQLLSAVVVFENGRPVWRHIGRAQLVMRDFSDAFLHDYVNRHKKDLLTTVGCYKLETEGAQLFSQVKGDYFTILGLPLIELLGFLRTRGVIPT